MNATEIQAHAAKLMAAHGAKAVIEAAEKARKFEQSGDEEQARDWRRVSKMLQQMRGPHAS